MFKTKLNKLKEIQTNEIHSASLKIVNAFKFEFRFSLDKGTLMLLENDNKNLHSLLFSYETLNCTIDLKSKSKEMIFSLGNFKIDLVTNYDEIEPIIVNFLKKKNLELKKSNSNFCTFSIKFGSLKVRIIIIVKNYKGIMCKK